MLEKVQTKKPRWYAWLYDEIGRLSCNAWASTSRFVWGDAEKYSDGTLVQSERAICGIRGFAILGLIPVALYGAIASYCTDDHCGAQHGAWIAVLRGVSIALLGAIAAFSVGGLLGFLFGVPRWGESTVVVDGARRKTDAAQGAGAPAEAGKGGDKPAASDSAPSAQSAGVPPSSAGNAGDKPVEDPGAARANRVRPNTGLEKVMDWLTTLIVGLGLVHLGTAAQYGREISGWLTTAIAGESLYATQTNFTGGATILLAYAIAGFMLVYLWAQRNWGKEMALADLESNTIQNLRRVVQQAQAKVEAAQATVQQAQAQVQEVKKTAARKLTGVTAAVELFAQKAAGGSETLLMTAEIDDLRDPARLMRGPLAGLDLETCKEISERYGRDTDWFYEPMADFGPQEANGRRLDASVKTIGTTFYEITLTVRSIAPSPAIAGQVVFFLHHTLPSPVRRVEVVDGVAATVVLSAGSFVAGAIVVSEPTIKLSLDLAKLADVPEEFREN